jgi:hypothetical protein
MKPPIVYDVTIPSNHIRIRITAIVCSTVCFTSIIKSGDHSETDLIDAQRLFGTGKAKLSDRKTASSHQETLQRGDRPPRDKEITMRLWGTSKPPAGGSHKGAVRIRAG